MRGRPEEIAGMLRSLTGWTQEEIRNAFGGECEGTTPERAKESPSVRRQTFMRATTDAHRPRTRRDERREGNSFGWLYAGLGTGAAPKNPMDAGGARIHAGLGQAD